jgi:glycosyltransferase involved in cell wall biosynthesis
MRLAPGDGMPTSEVSVVIPTYNRSAFLNQAMRSVLTQTFSGFELVVTDNASTDNTSALVASFADPRIRYVPHDHNLGMVPNWNEGIAQTRGHFVALLEDDNWWDPEFLARTVAVLARRPEVGFVYTAAFLTDASGTARQLHQRWDSDEARTGLEELGDLVRGNRILLSTVLMRRTCYDAVGPFDESIRYAADWEMWMRLALRYGSAYISTPLAYYRQHEASGTARIHAIPYALYFDHRMILDKTLQGVQATFGRGPTAALRRAAYRWLVELQAERVRRSFAAGQIAQAHGEALLALRCGPEALSWSGGSWRVLFFALLPPSLLAVLGNLVRRVDHAVRRRARTAF